MSHRAAKPLAERKASFPIEVLCLFLQLMCTALSVHVNCRTVTTPLCPTLGKLAVFVSGLATPLFNTSTEPLYGEASSCQVMVLPSYEEASAACIASAA